MKLRSLTGPALAALFTVSTHVSAAPTAAPGYAAIPIYTHSNADSIVSYDWAGAGDLYYQTSASYSYGGFYQWSGGTLNALQAGSGTMANGASVVTIGDFVYFNVDTYSSTPIRRYGPVNGVPTLTEISTTTNYALHTHAGDLFITGAVNFGPTNIYHSAISAGGDLVNDPAVSIGNPGGGSGPLAFDNAGNLFYAPGFFDRSIYRWSAADVAAAIANPGGFPLTAAGNLWLDYSLLYPDQGGATSMLVDSGGDLLVTITDYTEPSFLTRFDVAFDGSYAGTREDILTDDVLIGQLRAYEGGIFVSSENAIYQIVPEPGTVGLLCFAFAALGLRRGRGSV